MPSSYTGSGVELIGAGEQSGTWNTTTNTNLQILDRMVSQAGAISLSGTSHTLTVSDGILSDGQYGILVFGGSPSGTNTVTISPNDARRTYIVKNSTAQTVIMSQGSGSTVSVPAGQTAVMYCDGAGTGAAVVDLTTTLADFGITASATELNYTDGVTSSIQTQLDGKAANTAASIATSISLTGAASAWQFSLSGNDLLISYGGTTKAKLDTSGNLTVAGDVTAFGTF
jgi:hypothetical protein